MLRRARAVWRRARGVPVVRQVIAAADRRWWTRVIERADIVDVDYVVAQGHPPSAARAIRTYVRGGHRTGMALNPLFMERLVSSQLSDAGRVPALYAYLVNDVSQVRTSVAWDAVGYAARHPDFLEDPAGPLGHAWRAARRTGRLEMLGGQSQAVEWSSAHARAVRAAATAFEPNTRERIPPLHADLIFLVRIATDEPEAAAALDAAIEVSAATGAISVMSLTGSGTDVWTAASLLALQDPRMQVVHDRPGIVDEVRAQSAAGAVLLVRGRETVVSATDLLAVARHGASGPTAPLWLADDGTVASAGVVVRDQTAFHLLAGHPIEDARSLGATVQVAAVAGETFALPVTSGAVAPAATTLLTAVARSASDRRLPPPESWTTTGIDVDIDDVLGAGGLRVGEWGPSGPALIRPARTTTLPDGREVPCLRWAITTAAPPGDAGEAWGDTHFARGVAAALRRAGQEVVIDAYAARLRPSRRLDDVVLALRGPEPIEAQRGAVSILWVISHPDQITAAELRGFDACFAASDSWARAASRRFGRPVVPLLQCTDPRRFHPTGAARSADIVFVGTARGIHRPSVIEPLRAGIPVAVYGPDWRGWVPAGAIKASGIPNDELPLRYETAAVVLNDHWPAMKRNGFVSNRLFDVVAAGGRAISDAVDGIDAIFGPTVRTYESIPELLALLRAPADRVFAPEHERAAISQGIRERHSFDARAAALLDAALGRHRDQGAAE